MTTGVTAGGRPRSAQRPIRPSRKKYQEALRCLKQAVKTPTLPWVQRIRACELICAIYGVVPLPEMGANRTRKVIKDLVEEHEFERRLRTDLEAKVRQRVISDAEAAARSYLAEIEQAEEAGTNDDEDDTDASDADGDEETDEQD